MADPTPAPQYTHHYILTLEMPQYASFTVSGVMTPRPGATRDEVYTEIRRDATKDDPRMTRANVVFFSLEPNQL